MIRKIIHIDEDKCIGCGLCAEACHEGAIGMIDGKAKLMRDDYCDGLGDCLPVCPTDAISFIEREAAAYDESAVKANQEVLPCGCPGTHARSIDTACVNESVTSISPRSQLRQWPVQIKLVPVRAPYFTGANLLIAADCTAYAHGNFHNRFMKNKVALIGCPKLDEVNYAQKLTEIIRENDIQSITVVRMEVPCCAGIAHTVRTALMGSGKTIPWHIVTLSTDGQIIDE